MRILILEDNKQYAQLAQEFVPGATVVINIKTALRELETKQYGVLVTDLFMQTPDRFVHLIRSYVDDAYDMFARHGYATRHEREQALMFDQKPAGLMALARACKLNMLALVVTSQNHHKGPGRAVTAAARTITYYYYKQKGLSDRDAKWVAYNLVVVYQAHKGVTTAGRNSIWPYRRY